MNGKIYLTILSAILTIFIILGSISYFIGSYFFNIALDATGNLNNIKVPVDAATNLTATDQWFSTKDGLKLSGYIFESEKKSNKWVIAVHGYRGNAYNISTVGENFNANSYNVLLIDLRGHGSSEGDYISMGIQDSHDLIRWCNYLNTEYADIDICLYGISMGGATVMSASGNKALPKNVKCIVEDCGFTSAKAEFTHQLKTLYGRDPFPIIPIANLYTKFKAGFFFGEFAPIKMVKKSKAPILFIHGDLDSFVPFDMVNDLYAVAKQPKELFIVKGANHAGSELIDSKKYYATIFNFIDKYM
ncbi:MAG: alpha/beta hydrolase [Clostridia bacterium]